VRSPLDVTPQVSVPTRSLQRLHRLQTSSRHLQRDVLTVLAWGSVATALGLWVADGGIQTVTSGAKVLVAGGIVTGLVATDLMVIMLILAARIPYVDAAIGHDRAIALHNKLGKWVLFGLLFHAIILICGYAAQDSIGVLSEFASFLGVSDLLLSVVGLVTLSVVAITSIMAVKRSLPYEVWHVIHLTTYAAVGLSLLHQFSVSGLFAQGTWQRWYWLALFTLVALGLLSFRFLFPLFTSLEHRLVVSRVVLEDTDVVSIEMRGRGLDRLGAEAGHSSCRGASSVVGSGGTSTRSPCPPRLPTTRCGSPSGRSAAVRPSSSPYVPAPASPLRVRTASSPTRRVPSSA